MPSRPSSAARVVNDQHAACQRAAPLPDCDRQRIVQPLDRVAQRRTVAFHHRAGASGGAHAATDDPALPTHTDFITRLCPAKTDLRSRVQLTPYDLGDEGGALRTPGIDYMLVPKVAPDLALQPGGRSGRPVDPPATPLNQSHRWRVNRRRATPPGEPVGGTCGGSRKRALQNPLIQHGPGRTLRRDRHGFETRVEAGTT